MARALGTPFIPWQEYVSDVAGERLPNGEYAYRVVVVSVPRQSGKTVLIRSVGSYRAAINGRDVFYTAQKGKDAAERFADLTTAIATSPFRKRVKVRRSAGSQRVTFVGGADFRAFAPTEDSLHGYTPPTVMLDEAYAHTAAMGDMLMQAIGPAQMTVKDRQLWIVSTAGTLESGFLREWMTKGLEGAPRVACFIWGAAPLGLAPEFDHLGAHVDPYTPEGVAAYHPGVGFMLNGAVLTAEDVVANAANESPASFERGYANRWTRTASDLITRDAWRALATEAEAPPTRRLVLAYDVAHDGLSSSITATWRGPGGKPHTKVVLAAGGSSWLADEVADLAVKWRPAAVATYGGGAAAEVTDDLTARGVEVTVVSGAERATATARVLAHVAEAGLTHDGGEVLELAATGVVTRPTDDGVVFSRRHSSGDVSAMVGLTAGIWALDHVPAALPAPRIVVREGAA